MTPNDSTSSTLLQRLRRSEAAPGDWEQFCRLYAPLLLAWAKRQGLRDEDAMDVAQNVLLILIRKLPSYVKQPNQSFRSWLYTITKHQAIDFQRQRNRFPQPIAVGDAVDRAELPDPLAEDREFQIALVHRACEIIRPEFSDRVWQAFERFKRQAQPIDQVSAALAMPPNTVHAYSSRVMRRLREVISGFIDE